MNLSIVEVIFKVSAPVKFGEEIRICGNVPALGADNVARAIPLVTTTVDYPWWQTKAMFLPGEEGAVTYRYCVFSGGKFSRWEGSGTIRRVLSFQDSKENVMKHIIDYYGSLTVQPPPTSESPAKKSGFKAITAATPTTLSDKHNFKSKQFSEWSARSRFNFDLQPQDSVIIISYFLPVVLTKDKVSGRWSADWDRENVLSLKLDARCTWVGSVRYHNAPIAIEDQEAVTLALSDLNCFPLFLDQHTHHQFYDLYCKQHLWMMMHHIGEVYGPLNLGDLGTKNQQDLWSVYCKVNQIFRSKLVEVFHTGDLIWIHGFHLMLLPSLLRRGLSRAKIGYFFHTPFPSSELWRSLTRREDLLRGILAADQIGFHLYEYARHFVTSCHRILGYSSEMNASGKFVIQVDGRPVSLSCIHLGVDRHQIEDTMRDQSFPEKSNVWREKFPGKVIVASIDRLERLKGIPLKLIAIDQFLAQNSDYRGKIVFVLLGISAQERGEDYRQTCREVRGRVDRLNRTWGTINPTSGEHEPVIYFEERIERQVNLSTRLALFAASDILMITATRDGLNRLPMEFTLARHVSSTSTCHSGGGGGGGVIILSEFVSSARVMRGSLIVNPWKVEEVKNALLHALEMKPSELAERTRRNLEFTCRLTINSWALTILHDLKSTESSVSGGEEGEGSPTRWGDASVMKVGMGMGFRLIGVQASFRPLDEGHLIKSYRSSRSRLILLDWGGTLIAEEFKKDSLQAYAVAQGKGTLTPSGGLSPEIKSTLEALCADRKNVVFVVSGKDMKSVQDYFGGVKGLGLAAEHGYYYMWPKHMNVNHHSNNDHSDFSPNTSTPIKSPISPTGFSPSPSLSTHSHSLSTPSPSTGHGHWNTMFPLGDQSWRESVITVMEIYEERTHGTYIEKKGNSLIWQFRDADPEFGFLQSKQLEEHLKDVVLASFPSVEVLRGGGFSDGYIEVRPSGLSKGLFLEHAFQIMKNYQQSTTTPTYNNYNNYNTYTNNLLSPGPDFILAMGDDSSDEPMFDSLSRMRSLEGLSLFSVTVGMKPSSAQCYIEDPSKVLEVLSTLVKTTEKENKRSMSVMDLSQLKQQFSPESGSGLGGGLGGGRMGIGMGMGSGVPFGLGLKLGPGVGGMGMGMGLNSISPTHQRRASGPGVPFGVNPITNNPPSLSNTSSLSSFSFDSPSSSAYPSRSSSMKSDRGGNRGLPFDSAIPINTSTSNNNTNNTYNNSSSMSGSFGDRTRQQSRSTGNLSDIAQLQSDWARSKLSANHKQHNGGGGVGVGGGYVSPSQFGMVLQSGSDSRGDLSLSQDVGREYEYRGQGLSGQGLGIGIGMGIGMGAGFGIDAESGFGNEVDLENMEEERDAFDSGIPPPPPPMTPPHLPAHQHRSHHHHIPGHHHPSISSPHDPSASGLCPNPLYSQGSMLAMSGDGFEDGRGLYKSTTMGDYLNRVGQMDEEDVNGIEF